MPKSTLLNSVICFLTLVADAQDIDGPELADVLRLREGIARQKETLNAIESSLFAGLGQALTDAKVRHAAKRTIDAVNDWHAQDHGYSKLMCMVVIVNLFVFSLHRR